MPLSCRVLKPTHHSKITDQLLLLDLLNPTKRLDTDYARLADRLVCTCTSLMQPFVGLLDVRATLFTHCSTASLTSPTRMQASNEGPSEVKRTLYAVVSLQELSSLTTRVPLTTRPLSDKMMTRMQHTRSRPLHGSTINSDLVTHKTLPALFMLYWKHLPNQIHVWTARRTPTVR